MTTIHITGTASKVLLENCCMVKVRIDAVLYGVTLINSKDCVVVIAAEPPQVTIKHCVAIGLLLNHDKMDSKIECNSSAAVMVTSPTRDCLKTRLCLTVEELEKAPHFMACEIPPYINAQLVDNNWVCDLGNDMSQLRTQDRVID
jgi:hypothetical protein